MKILQYWVDYLTLKFPLSNVNTGDVSNNVKRIYDLLFLICTVVAGLSIKLWIPSEGKICPQF